MLGVGRDLCGSSSPTLLPKQGHPEQAAQDLFQVGLEYLQRRRLHNLPGQPGPGLCHPQREAALPRVQAELPLLQFVPVKFSQPLPLFNLGKLVSLRLLRKSTQRAELSYRDQPEELSSQPPTRELQGREERLLIAGDVSVNWPLHQTGERYRLSCLSWAARCCLFYFSLLLLHLLISSCSRVRTSLPENI